MDRYGSGEWKKLHFALEKQYEVILKRLSIVELRNDELEAFKAKVEATLNEQQKKYKYESMLFASVRITIGEIARNLDIKLGDQDE